MKAEEVAEVMRIARLLVDADANSDPRRANYMEQLSEALEATPTASQPTLAPSAPTEREIREQAINGAWCAKEMHEAWMKQQLEKAVELLPKDSPALPAIYGAMYVDTRPLSRKEWEYGLELAAFLPPAPAAEKE